MNVTDTYSDLSTAAFMYVFEVKRNELFALMFVFFSLCLNIAPCLLYSIALY